MFWKISLFLILLFRLSEGQFYSQDNTKRNYFLRDEISEYSIWWGKPFFASPQKIIKAGSGILTAKIRTQKLQNILVIESDAKSYGIIGAFYSIDNHSVTIANPETFEPISTHQLLTQGDYYRKTDINFNCKNKTISYSDFLRKNGAMKANIDSINIPNCAGIFDIISAFFKVRTMNLNPPDTIFVNVFDTDHKIFSLPVIVLRKEIISTIFGKKTACVVIQPLLGDYAAMFIKTGSLFLWFTDDDNKILVKAETEIKIGKVIVQLERFTAE